MKKLAIIGASAALAALPAVGVFAADTTEVTDTINVTISESCTLGIENGVTKSETLASGGVTDIERAAFSISCNDAGGWHLSAQGDGTGSTKTDMVGETETNKIPTGASVAGGTSAWAFKVTASDGVEEGFDTLHMIPSTATKIAGGSSPVSAKSVKIGYKVSASAEQAADTYTGKVKYTLAKGAE